MSKSQFVIDVNTADFVKVVIEGSHKQPVLVDFWANWCAPCRSLSPILDKIAAAYNGKLIIAKVNTDQEQQLASQLGIRSLPTVRLFINGKAAGEFMGALPEAGVREFLERHIPQVSNKLLRQVDTLLAQGNLQQAVAVAEQAYADNTNDIKTQLVYAKVKLTSGDYSEVERILAALPLPEQSNPEVKVLQAKLFFARIAAQAPSQEQLRQNLIANPKDSASNYHMAAYQIMAGAYQDALDTLLTLLRRDRNYGDDAARKAILGIFNILENKGDLVARYRAKLTNALF
ncbi:thioredoxin [Achromatium sp. WMS2]|nr:thioredoxin [Achromatium sp. WMS2]